MRWNLKKVRGNMNEAFKRVVKNKVSHGIDGLATDELLSYLKENGTNLRQSLLDGTYDLLPVRRVEIPKDNGKKRQLGIPTVVDRVVQQSIAQILSPIFEKTFSDNGNLSPLLSNIMLNELDKELTNRGLKFARYADDCNIYVKSEKTANRIKQSITRYIEQGLKLKVHEKSIKKLKNKLKLLTGRRKIGNIKTTY